MINMCEDADLWMSVIGSLFASQICTYISYILG